jgi:hypothetical protein
MMHVIADMLDELGDAMDNTDARLTRETQHVIKVTEKAKSGGKCPAPPPPHAHTPTPTPTTAIAAISTTTPASTATTLTTMVIVLPSLLTTHASAPNPLQECAAASCSW